MRLRDVIVLTFLLGVGRQKTTQLKAGFSLLAGLAGSWMRLNSKY